MKYTLTLDNGNKLTYSNEEQAIDAAEDLMETSAIQGAEVHNSSGELCTTIGNITLGGLSNDTSNTRL